MTAKEQLRERIEALSENEASEALRLLDLRGDPVIAAFRDAPADDEPWTQDDEAAATEGRADIAVGARSRSSKRLPNSTSEPRPWHVELTRSATRDLRRPDPPVRLRVQAALQVLTA